MPATAAFNETEHYSHEAALEKFKSKLCQYICVLPLPPTFIKSFINAPCIIFQNQNNLCFRVMKPPKCVTIKRCRGRPKKVVYVDRKEYLHSYYKNHYSPSFNPDAKIGRPIVPDEQKRLLT